MSEDVRNRIDAVFAARRAEGSAAMIFYLTAGFPDMASTDACIDALVEGGMDLLELGVPFSDPIADGPTIQHSSYVALERGATLEGMFEVARRARERHPELPILPFTAYNPVFRTGIETFVERAAEAGVDGLLVPDLPPEEGEELREVAHRAGLHVIFLVAPTTSAERCDRIVKASSGFVYYISLKGVTGARAELPPDLEKHVRQVKALSDIPVAVGFGVSTPEQARAVASFADGVVVGSAVIKQVGDDPNDPAMAGRVRDFASSLSRAIRPAQAG